ncbi:MAG: hypothetical protein ACTTIO_04235 [Candidatus Fimenecus sp.]
MNDILKIKTLNKCKRLIAFVLFVLFLIIPIFSLLVSAKTGRNDRDGGHYDYDTGTYAFYHGHSAHQHPNGICPYGDYDEYWDYYDNCPKSGYENLYQKAKPKAYKDKACQKASATFVNNNELFVLYLIAVAFSSIVVGFIIGYIIIKSVSIYRKNRNWQELTKDEKIKIYLFCSIFGALICLLAYF